MSHRPHSPRVPHDESVLPSTIQDVQRFSDDDNGEQMELIDGSVPIPDPGPPKDSWREGESRASSAPIT